MSNVLNKNGFDAHPVVKLMAYQEFALAQQSEQTNVLEVSAWRGAATVIIAGAFTATNPTVSYAAHIATPITNPSVWLQSEDTSALFAEDGPEMARFIELMDREMSLNPDSVVAADEAQLDRIAKLIAGVRL